MNDAVDAPSRKPGVPVLTHDLLLGDAARWRRFGEVTPAGGSEKSDGTPDYGLFGPGSIMWEVLLHPATIVFETAAQAAAQTLYMPITAGIRDADPISRKARAGRFTMFDFFERFQRNSGMHAPMWLGDTTTATNMAMHLHRIHGHVKGPVIDPEDPSIGGYAAAEPRDAMWAAITELHGTLCAYEKLAWHGDEAPQPLTAEQRDQFVREMASYLRLVGAEEAEIPLSMAELNALYGKYSPYFGHRESVLRDPETGVSMNVQFAQVARENWHPSHALATDALKEVYEQWNDVMPAILPEHLQRAAGRTQEQIDSSADIIRRRESDIREIQSPENEARIMRLLWGPDGVDLIENARRLHRKATSQAA
ncbi:oxygenase MpaB family protein [Leifsonia sp. AG29]|uniref:oxygenase MpaB family protein n=1 Tax=Leifsonia sp. AG29 TaxID=2598860 RepID=UPI0018EEEA73|nr:oxygenase MpaB family protein [Leifsonia sp. AG29]